MPDEDSIRRNSEPLTLRTLRSPYALINIADDKKRGHGTIVWERNPNPYRRGRLNYKIISGCEAAGLRARFRGTGSRNREQSESPGNRKCIIVARPLDFHSGAASLFERGRHTYVAVRLVDGGTL